MKSKQKKSHKKKGSDSPRLKSQVCQVCRLDDFDEDILQKLQCTCTNWAHKYCYDPQFKDKSVFKCDVCKKNKADKKKAEKCCVCEADNGILKQVTGGEASCFVHVLCALVSPKIRIISYKSLIFRLNPEYQQKAIQQKQCFCCKKVSPNLIKCGYESCERLAHINCVLTSKYTGCSIVYNLFDKNEYSLLTNLQAYAKMFRNFSILRAHPSGIKIFVCQDHNDCPYFNWCLCKENIRIDELVECEKCRRWYHKSCQGVKNTDTFTCKGCKNKLIFERSLLLPEIIDKISIIQTSEKLDKKSLDLLDKFPFQLSQVLIKKLTEQKNASQIEKYYLKKRLQNHQQQLNKKVTLEILYLLIKKEYKDEAKITNEDWRSCLTSLEKNRLGWNDVNRSESKYRKLIQQELKSNEKGEPKIFLAKIEEFLSKSNSQLSNPQIIAKDVFEIVRSCEKNEQLKTYFQSINTPSNFFELFFESKAKQEDIAMFLKTYFTVLYRKKKEINQQQYNSVITMKFPHVLEKKNLIMQQMIKQAFKEYKIKKDYQIKEELCQRLEQKLSKAKLTFEQRRKEKENLIKNEIFIDKNSIIYQFEVNELFYKALLIKCIQMIKHPRVNQIEKLLKNINNLLQNNGHLIQLTESEINQFKKFQGKYNFYHNLINYSNRLRKIENQMPKIEIQEQNSLAYNKNFGDHIIDESQSSGQNDRRQSKKIERASKISNSILQKATQVLAEWGQSQQQILYALGQCKILIDINPEFDEPQRQIIFTFIEQIVTQVSKIYSSYAKKLNSSILVNTCEIAIFGQCQGSFLNIMQEYEKYKAFKKDVSFTMAEIGEILENQHKTEDLSHIITKKIEEIQGFSIDLSIQLKKFKVIKMWCALSQKFLSQNKLTPAAIQQLKQFTDKLNYPPNKILRQIGQLNEQSKILQKKIKKFLQKPKIYDFEIYEEFRFISNKMTIEQAEDLKSSMLKVNLQVSSELQELTECLSDFKKIPKQLSPLIMNATHSDELQSIRNKILETPFKYDNMVEYQSLINKIYSLRCSEFSGETNRKDYYRMMTLGGYSAVQLLEKTSKLYSNYKQVEKAEKQLISHKPRQQNLLFFDPRRWKNEFKEDINQKQNIQRYLATETKLRQKFQYLKNKKSDFTEFIILENQLQRCPFNCRDIITQINRMKMDLEQIVSRTMRHHSQFDTNFSYEVINKYKSNGIRNEYMQKFTEMNNKYVGIFEMGRRINQQNYVKFTICCDQTIEFQRHDQINQLRQSCFYAMSDQCLQIQNLSVQLCNTLMSQGGHLLTKKPESYLQIKQILEVIHDKKDKLLSKQQSPREEGQESSDEDLQDNQDDDEDDIDEDDLDEEQSDSDNYLEIESEDQMPIQHRNFKDELPIQSKPKISRVIDEEYPPGQKKKNIRIILSEQSSEN